MFSLSTSSNIDSLSSVDLALISVVQESSAANVFGAALLMQPLEVSSTCGGKTGADAMGLAATTVADSPMVSTESLIGYLSDSIFGSAYACGGDESASCMSRRCRAQMEHSRALPC